MRMTQSMLARSNLSYISNNYKQYSEILDRINSGKKITRPSQDPVVAIKGMAYRAQVTETEQFERNLIELSNWMDNTDASLDETTQVLIRIKELTIQASNETYTTDQRRGIAEEVNQLREHLEALGNTVVNNQHIFNGTNVKMKPVDLTAIEADFTQSQLGNGSDFHLRYGGNRYTFKHESKESYVFASGDNELVVSKKRPDITLIKNGQTTAVPHEEVIISNKRLSDVTGNEDKFAVYYGDKLYTYLGDGQYQNGNDTLNISTVDDSDVSIISIYNGDLSKITSKNIVHYQDKPYVFAGEKEGLLVYKNGDRQIEIDPKAGEITHTFPNESTVQYQGQPYEFEGKVDNRFIYKNGEQQITFNPITDEVMHTFPDEPIENGSELIVHYQGQSYKFEGENGEEGPFVYKNGNQQIKINPMPLEITFISPNAEGEPEDKSLNKEDLMISINKEDIVVPIDKGDVVISNTIRQDIKPSNGIDFLVHFENNQYTFEKASQSGDEKYKVFEYTSGMNKLTIKELINPPSFSDINEDNASEFSFHYQETGDTFIFDKEENGQLLYVSGDHQIKVNPENGSFTSDQDIVLDDLTIIKEPSVTFNGEHIDRSDIIISSKDGISSNAQDFEIEIMKGIKMNVNIRPQNVFSAQLYKDLSDLVKVLDEPSNSGSDVNAFLSKIEGHIDNVVNERSDLGARYNRVELITNRLSRQDMVAKQMLSENEDIDFEKVITDLKIQEMVHQAALAVGARIIQPTLMDFLR